MVDEVKQREMKMLILKSTHNREIRSINSSQKFETDRLKSKYEKSINLITSGLEVATEYIEELSERIAELNRSERATLHTCAELQGENIRLKDKNGTLTLSKDILVKQLEASKVSNRNITAGNEAFERLLATSEADNEDLLSDYAILERLYDTACVSLGKAQAENMSLTARINALEKNAGRTEYWQDKAGRWRHPKTGKCVKTADVMAAKLLDKTKTDKLNLDLYNAGGVGCPLQGTGVYKK